MLLIQKYDLGTHYLQLNVTQQLASFQIYQVPLLVYILNTSFKEYEGAHTV